MAPIPLNAHAAQYIDLVVYKVEGPNHMSRNKHRVIPFKESGIGRLPSVVGRVGLESCNVKWEDDVQLRVYVNDEPLEQGVDIKIRDPANMG
jgi:hypothetical protein